MTSQGRIGSAASEADYLARCFRQAFGQDAQLAAEGYLYSSERRRERALLRTVIRTLAAFEH